MSNIKSLKELIVLSIFIFEDEKYKKENTVYASEDGNVFIEENRAKLHVKGKKDMKYFPITRAEALGNEANDSKKSDDLDEAVIAEKTKELAELDLATANYQQLKGLVTFFQIETEDMKQPTLVTALTEYKTKISA